MKYKRNPKGLKNLIKEMLLPVAKKYPDQEERVKYYIREFSTYRDSLSENKNAIIFLYRVIRFHLMSKHYRHNMPIGMIKQRLVLADRKARKWSKAIGLRFSFIKVTDDKETLESETYEMLTEFNFTTFLVNFKHFISNADTNEFRTILEYSYIGKTPLQVLKEMECLEAAEGAQLEEDIRSGKRKSKIPASKLDWGKPVINFIDGFFWERLDSQKSSKEGKAMGHCGNTPSSDTREHIYSLRQLHLTKRNGKDIERFSVHATFIISEIKIPTGRKKVVTIKKPTKGNRIQSWDSYFVDDRWDFYLTNEYIDTLLKQKLPSGHPDKEKRKKLSRPQQFRKIEKVVDEKTTVFVLGESKGRFNEKIDKKFHTYVLALLDSAYVDLNIGGGYLEEENFKLSDFNDEMTFTLFNRKPWLYSFNELRKRLGDSIFLKTIIDSTDIFDGSGLDFSKMKPIKRKDETWFVLKEGNLGEILEFIDIVLISENNQTYISDITDLHTNIEEGDTHDIYGLDQWGFIKDRIKEEPDSFDEILNKMFKHVKTKYGFDLSSFWTDIKERKDSADEKFRDAIIHALDTAHESATNSCVYNSLIEHIKQMFTETEFQKNKDGQYRIIFKASTVAENLDRYIDDSEVQGNEPKHHAPDILTQAMEYFSDEPPTIIGDSFGFNTENISDANQIVDDCLYVDPDDLDYKFMAEVFIDFWKRTE